MTVASMDMAAPEPSDGKGMGAAAQNAQAAQMMQGMLQQGMMGMGMPQEGEVPAPGGGMREQTPLEEKGEDSDEIVGHLTMGEVVVPADILKNPQAKKRLQTIFSQYGVDMNRYTVGHPSNQKNEETGYPAFWNPFTDSWGFGTGGMDSFTGFLEDGWDDLTGEAARFLDRIGLEDEFDEMLGWFGQDYYTRDERAQIRRDIQFQNEQDMRRYKNELKRQLQQRTEEGLSAARDEQAEQRLKTIESETKLKAKLAQAQSDAGVGRVLGSAATPDETRPTVQARSKPRKSFRRGSGPNRPS